ncbi:MAG: DUF4097 family beta strand repeat-containing protein [bacterium]
MRRTRRIGVVLIWLWLIACWPAGTGLAADKEYSFDYQRYSFEHNQIVTITRPVLLDLQVARGKVNITGSENGRLVIEAVKRVYAATPTEAEEIANNIEIKVDQSGRTIRIQTGYVKVANRTPSFWRKILGAGADSYGIVDYTIQVPVATDIHVIGMDLEIDVSSIEGEITIENETGSTHGEFLVGPVTIHQETGNINLDWIDGDVRIKSTSCITGIHQVRGALDVTTHSGNVSVKTELNSPRDYFVETVSGSITFLVPEIASGVLQIETRSGAMQTDMPVTIRSISNKRLVGKFGRGGPRITLTSASGDVRVAQY